MSSPIELFVLVIQKGFSLLNLYLMLLEKIFLFGINMPSQARALLQTIQRKPTGAADGRSNAQAASAVGASNGEKTGLFHDLTHMGLRNTQTVAHALTTLASGEPMDDKDLMLENGVSMLQGFAPNSGLSETISDGFITMLWSDLPHPNPTLAGPAARYRRHDGGGNNPWHTEMGKAGTPYARNVPPMKPKGLNLPDVNDVFDALLKRDGPYRKHPSGLNRLFFSFATIVIHECFQTSRKDPFINETSSYVDLSTLYGNHEKDQARVRTYANGLIHPDSIASDRIMMMPPGVVAVLLLFSRNHNRIAENLFLVNEEGKYKNWDSLDNKQKKWQDEDIFQLTRNINVGFFATVVLKDYVSAILNTPRAGSEWSLNLGKEIKQAGKRVDRASGNVVSVEFAVLYHWHAALSAADDKWMADIIHSQFPDVALDDVTVEMFHEIMKNYGHKLAGTPPKDWTFGGFKRQADGRFKDTELADLIKSAIEEPAHAFGAHGTPASLRVVDLMGQLQARNVFNVCTLNEFRRYLNLKSYDNFEEWNPDKEVARAAELLYGHIENLELYPGLMAECTKPAMPGSGVCPGQTTGRGILDDAVALVRGDRFLSYDFNSSTLTNWGAAMLQESAGGSYGGMLPRLLFNALPGDFTGTSPYALLPFYTPDATRGILKGNQVTAKYDMSRPPSGMPVLSVQTREGCKAVLEDRQIFRELSRSLVQQDAANGHSNGHTNGSASAKMSATETSRLMKAAFFEPGYERNASEFFSGAVRMLIEKNSLSFSKGRRTVDIVRDVTNIAPMLWLADRFAIPLKTDEQPRGMLSIYETFGAFLVLFVYHSFNVMPVNEWKLREAATAADALLRPVFEAHIKTQKGYREAVVDWLAKGSAFEVKPHADRLYHALNDTRRPVSELATQLIDLSVGLGGNLTQQASLLIDLFLSPGYETYKDRIVKLAKLNTPEADRELQGFVYEGMRHAPVVPGLPRVATADVSVTDGSRGAINIKRGQTVLVATSKVAMDPKAYPEPEKLKAGRTVSDHSLMGHGLDDVRTAKLIVAALAAVLREVFKLKNVRRAPGKLGSFTTTELEFDGVVMKQYLDASAKESPIPTSFSIQYDS